MHRRAVAHQRAVSHFAFETTLASRSFVPWLVRLRRDHAYRFHLLYLWLPDAEESVRRIAERVRQGGHHVPDEVVRRRFARGLSNFLTLYTPIADAWALYDNSAAARLIAKCEPGGEPEIRDAETWRMIARQAQVKEHEGRYETGAGPCGIRGVSFDEITATLRQAGLDAWRRHKALGHPIVIWRDGEVVTVLPEEIDVSA